MNTTIPCKCPETIKNAFDASGKQKTLASGEFFGRRNRLEDDINLSSIYDKLIRETGRWTERYASDLLIDIDAFKRQLAEITHRDTFDPEDSYEDIFGFGIRRDGVDGNAFIMSRLIGTVHKPYNYVCVSHEYRKILLLKVCYLMDDEKGFRFEAELRDATDSFSRIAETDLETHQNSETL